MERAIRQIAPFALTHSAPTRSVKMKPNELLSPRLQLRVAQKQILTPGLVQMVTVLQLNRLELQDMITQEIAENPVLEEAVEDGSEELTPEEVQALLEAERDLADPIRPTRESSRASARMSGKPRRLPEAGRNRPIEAALRRPTAIRPRSAEVKATTDPFDEIDFGSFFDDYLDPGYKSPASESIEKPSFETFLSSPVTLADHLHSQLSVLVLSEPLRDAAEPIIGNLDENGYLTVSLEELADDGRDPSLRTWRRR